MNEPCKCEVNISFLDDGKEEKIRGNKFVSSFVNKGNPKTSNEFDGPILQSYISHQMTDISKFLDSTKENIEIRNKNVADDVNELLKVMVSLKALDEKKDDIVLTLDRLEEIFKVYDKKYGKNKDHEMKKIHKLSDEIKTILHVSTRVDKEITGPKTVEAGRTKEKIKKFEEQLKEYQHNLKKESIYFYDTGPEASFQKIEEIYKKINELKETLKKFQYYEDMFKFPESESTGCEKIIDNIETEVGWMKKLWEHILKCQDQFEDFLKLKWSQMDVNEMEDIVKKLRQGLQPIKISDRKCNTFVGVSEEIKRWAIFIPMVTDLKHESMVTPDERHWKKVKSTVNREFTVNDNLPLSLVWEVRLFDYKETIEEICEIAKNEAKMDKEINAIIEFWKVVEFELVPLKNTDVSTLKMIEDHFEMLEGHQLSINTMLLSKFVAFFEKIFEQWKQDLGSVYDVVQLLSDVQKTWSFL